MRGIDVDILFLLATLLPLKASQRKGCDHADARRYEPREQIGFLLKSAVLVGLSQLPTLTQPPSRKCSSGTSQARRWKSGLWAEASVHERALAFSRDTISSARAL